MQQNNDTKKPIFTDQQIGDFVSLGHVLKKIHARLLKEGYRYIDGDYIPPIKNDIEK